ncbi:hypothetical protein CFC21_076217 [Triticum aestivum]|nr:hypothetical protein CFC21_076217 [Triticum aestivum]
MVEATILLVVQKIATAVALNAASTLANKAAAVVAIPSNMTLISNELELLQAFFMDIEMRGHSSQVTETLVAQARRLAYHIEDVVDQYIYVVGTTHQKASPWLGCVKKVAKKPKSLYTLDQIANEIQKINQRLQQLKQNRDWTQPTGNFPEKSYDHEHQLYIPGHDYLIADDDLVGLDKNRETLIKSLHLEDHPHLLMIAVWGMGGIGKSTLVSSVYRDQAANFQCDAWISISQSCKLDEIFQQMLEKLNVQDAEESDAENTRGVRTEEPRVKLKRLLQNRKYLIVLDDVWTPTDLLKIKEVLIDNGQGSRVIITTRTHDVASIADEGCKLKVDKLGDNDAWQLFCRKAFPKSDEHICPTDLHEYAKCIVDRCDGLPLALVAIGSMLSLRTNSAQEWKLFKDQLIWELGNNKEITVVGRILHLSYKDLPIYLKNCFLYCSIFPEDFPIGAAYLVKLLISEGFVDVRGTCSLEDVAKGYIIELVRRNMLQVLTRNSYGEISNLQMHDLVRELAILQARKESFSTVYDCTYGVVPSGLASRRIGLHKCNEDFTSNVDISKARTILCFDKSMRIDIWLSILEECKYIAVLDFSNRAIKVIPDSIGELFNLKFLNFDVTQVE